MNIAQQIPHNIKCVSRSVGYSLWLNHPDDWFGLSIILRARLDEQQRVALAFMALRSLDRDDAKLTAEIALAKGAGQPIAPLFRPLDEAVSWANIAAPDELEAYLLACFNRMAMCRQTAFLDFIQRRTAA